MSSISYIFVHVQVIEEFSIYLGSERVTVRAWDMSIVTNDTPVVCDAVGRLWLNPERVLTRMCLVADILSQLRPHMQLADVLAAVETARTKLRGAFVVCEHEDGVSIDHPLGNLRLEARTWRDQAKQMSDESGISIDSIRNAMLDNGRAELAAALCIAAARTTPSEPAGARGASAPENDERDSSR